MALLPDIDEEKIFLKFAPMPLTPEIQEMIKKESRDAKFSLFCERVITFNHRELILRNLTWSELTSRQKLIASHLLFAAKQWAEILRYLDDTLNIVVSMMINSLIPRYQRNKRSEVSNSTMLMISGALDSEYYRTVEENQGNDWVYFANAIIAGDYRELFRLVNEFSPQIRQGDIFCLFTLQQQMVLRAIMMERFVRKHSTPKESDLNFKMESLLFRRYNCMECVDETDC